jgi:hypothetical protein
VVGCLLYTGLDLAAISGNSGLSGFGADCGLLGASSGAASSAISCANGGRMEGGALGLDLGSLDGALGADIGGAGISGVNLAGIGAALD